VAPEAIAAEARRRSEDAVRQIREESGRRVAQRGRAGMSSCMLGVMVSMLLFVALQARSIHRAAKAAPIAASARDDAASIAPAAPKRRCYKACGISPRRSGTHIVCSHGDK
jgi:hypothetical protein